MTGLVIDAQACRGCGRCVRTCASGALQMDGRLARVNDACVLCGMCVDACPFDAIEIVRDCGEARRRIDEEQAKHVSNPWAG